MNYEEMSREELIKVCQNNDNFNYCKDIGDRYQDIVCEQLFKMGICLNMFSSRKYQMEKGENLVGIEIKRDSKIVETHRLYVEIEALNRKGDAMIEGGITKKDKSWLYVIGNEQECWLFAKSQLLMLYEKVKAKPYYWWTNYKVAIREHWENGVCTSRGMCIPLEILERTGWCIRHLVYESENYTN